MRPSPSCLFDPVTLPCGRILKNRLAKSAMSDSLGDGRGDPTPQQVRLYERWAEGGLGLSIVGEAQINPHFAEKPGNLVLNAASNNRLFADLARRAQTCDAQLWLQLGHAGALAYPPTSRPAGPSALDLPGLVCDELSGAAIRRLPEEFAQAAALARTFGFGGVQIHAAHGFLLSQFLSPLFNRRSDAFGGSVSASSRILVDIIESTRQAVGPDFPVAVKLNATDGLDGGLTDVESLEVVERLDSTSLDLIDISGGTYFPGAKASSDSAASGPYFLEFARQARKLTDKPLMATGGFKTREQAIDAVASGAVDLVGMARAFALAPNLADRWKTPEPADPQFPRFGKTGPGEITSWYTMRLSALAEDEEVAPEIDPAEAMRLYEARDRARVATWLDAFPLP
ncbi:oxidoreductase [Hoeflea sp. WL0058]|uniref:Oxidoreductase n=1 Tax=Flavimaribacter sediminis TaxID=2865987 RepID=A0AAE3D113_9HYPH|nr:oxidoreductase [Flavimaribacter sediminis]MBW8637477.1 oxidoreductase [Flavimaribacter sediminis]